MTHKILSIAAALIAALIMTACSADRTPAAIDDSIAEIHSAIARHDNARAKKLCDELSALPQGSVSARQYAGISLAYMQLSECEQMDDYTAQAFQCFRNAYKANPDSANAFFNSVVGEDARFVQMLQTLQQMIDSPDRGTFIDTEDHYPANDTLPSHEHPQQ